MSRAPSILALVPLIAIVVGCSSATQGPSPAGTPTADTPGGSLPTRTIPPAAATRPTSPDPSTPTTSSTPSTAPTSPALTQPTASAATLTASPAPTVGSAGSFDPANFTSTVDNPWFPLTPGTTLTYRGMKDGKVARETYKITDRTKVVDGVDCRLVEDQLFLDGKLAEDTVDSYVQDLAGNVWYFGEDTRILDPKGNVTSTEGSWHSGVDGAVAGIFMEPTQTVGHSYAQESYVGHAEDHFEVLSTSASVTVPYGSFADVVQTKEWTPLEPGVLDHKFWVRGIGEVREASVSDNHEELVLVSVDHS